MFVFQSVTQGRPLIRLGIIELGISMAERSSEKKLCKLQLRQTVFRQIFSFTRTISRAFI